MLISLLTLRLELPSDAPDLKFFKTYSAKARGQNQFTKLETKTYASVARGLSTAVDHQPPHKTIQAETSKRDKTHPHLTLSERRERHSSSSDSPFQISSLESELSSESSALTVGCSDVTEKTPADNLTCRGRRVFREIHIELIEEKELEALIMSEDSDVSLVNILEQEPSTSRGEKRHSASGDDDVEDGEEKFQVAHRERKTKSESEDRSSGSHITGHRPKSHSPTNKMLGTVRFYSGNPSVELTNGILHIYKDSQMTTLDKDVTRSEMLCMMGVPASYTIHDLIKFIAPMGDCVNYMQVLRDAIPNQYMLLIKFKDQTSADNFYTYFNNRPFNSIEPDICHLVYVAKIEVVNETEGGSLPLLDMTELPNCPVCLERMEESVDGILTVLCNHAFHTHCLAQWGDTSCPVCRYCQTPEAVADQRCMQCGSHESLWICLICGNVGCGRYVDQHAYKHFQDTNHTYAMQLGTNRVWDYAGDNYVHRLAQNKSDGKLVEVDEGGNEIQEEKLDSITLEYTYLLTTQLESQRLYFMEQIQEAVKDVETKLKESTDRLEKERLEREKTECKLSEVSKEKFSLEKKVAQLTARTSKVASDLQDERQMNKSLLENQQVWQGKITMLEERLKQISDKKDQEIAELQEQLRDVMFFLDAQQKFANSPGITQDELQGAQVIVGESAATPGNRGKKSRKKR
ncbi:BRCA1-associated protein-like [Physella acuta]|uniref:BRCA1-associated protein-like n=1 Tax=Physella acuta TaxID=109671 RepID=UPI0027DBB6B8|nr:BRCA1-associated protein-like [Physella acuta]